MQKQQWQIPVVVAVAVVSKQMELKVLPAS
jgi:hypothetical protein